MKPFSALTGKEKAFELLRWLCVPIAAAAALAIVIFIARLAMPPMYIQPPGSPPPPAPVIPRVVTYRAFSAIAALAFVLAGAKTAPRLRLVVALVLAGLWIAYAFLSRVVVHLPGTPHYLDFALAIAAAGGGAALIYCAEKSKRQATITAPSGTAE